MKKMLFALCAMFATIAYAQTYTTLGIGTSPVGTLHVHSSTPTTNSSGPIAPIDPASIIDPGPVDSYQTVFHITNTNTNKTATDGFSIIQDDNEVTLRQFEAAKLNIRGYNQQGITINTSGKVGIGTDAPTERLHVSGNAIVNGSMLIKSSVSSPDVKATGKFQSGRDNQTVTIGKAYYSGLDHAAAYIGFNADRGVGDNGTWTLKTDGTKNGGVVVMATMDGDLLISNIKTLSSFGSLPVGFTGHADRTSVSDNTIMNNVNLKLSADGKLFAKEVKVTLTDWPDYVFGEGYALPTLEQTEEYIKDNGHLPGVPSAVEIEEQGLNLGEMNKILMQKVEELTLQVIELNKQVKELKGE